MFKSGGGGGSEGGEQGKKGHPALSANGNSGRGFALLNSFVQQKHYQPL